jgi:hypothetical protein
LKGSFAACSILLFGVGIKGKPLPGLVGRGFGFG